ncbi:MAG: hypothetical protein GX885_11745 [Methanomicrobiales archaeon]|nr:hypothetical protein [Methanomicrobiales archaeon]
MFVMATYDEVLGFDYTDEKAWKEFATSDILPLYTAALRITEFSRHLREKLENSFSDAFLENKGIQKMLLGGITVDGEYAENSLARFYKEYIGVYIDPHLWVSLCKEPGTETLQHIQVHISRPSVLSGLNTILGLTGNLLRSVHHDLPEVDEETINSFIREPQRIVGELKRVYSQLIKISATYNYHTFFVMSTRSTPKFFLLEAYPRLKIHFDTVSGLLGLMVADIYRVNETIYQGDMVLIKHRPEGFADSLYQLNQIAWHLLSTFALFDSQVPPLQNEFIESIQVSTTDLRPLNEVFEARVYYLTDNGLNVLGYAGKSSYFFRTCEMSLQRFFHIAAPYLFVGLVDLEITNVLHTKYEEKAVGDRTALYVYFDSSSRYYSWDKWDS